MLQIDKILTLRNVLTSWRRERQTIVFVPTMGNLHAGHLALVQHARKLGERVIVSIFVNPLQFGINEDYDAYPRTLELDVQKLASEGVDILFTPSVLELYPRARKDLTTVNVPIISDILCGAARPGHFSGVATVVTLLFNLVQPRIAIFGEKDYQQLLIIKRLVEDLFLPIAIVSHPTVREADGLAMSSRNNYLNPVERKLAPYLHQTLVKMRDNLLMGITNYTALEQEGRDALLAAGFNPDYCVIRSALDLSLPINNDRQLIILAAAYLGKTRLIDNIKVHS